MSKLDTLVEVARPQEGYFSARQASQQGVSPQELYYYSRRGSITSICRGVYHVATFPRADHEELVALWLFTDQAGAFSHETALFLQGLSDALPSRPHLTLPEDWKARRLRYPFEPILYYREIPASELAWHGCVPMTNVSRTLRDGALDKMPKHVLEQAWEEARQRGLITRSDPKPTAPKPPAQRLEDLLWDVECGCCPPRESARLPHHFVRGYKLPEYHQSARTVIRELDWGLMRASSPALTRLLDDTPRLLPASQRLTNDEGHSLRLEPVVLEYELPIEKEDVRQGNYRIITELLSERARASGAELERYIFANLQASGEHLRNIVRGTGPVSFDAVLASLEQLELDFYPDGRLKSDLTMFVSPDDAARLADSPTTPEQETRFREIMTQKWREWLARQRRRRIR